MGYVGKYAQGTEAVRGDVGVCRVQVCGLGQSGGRREAKGGQWAVVGAQVIVLQSSVRG